MFDLDRVKDKANRLSNQQDERKGYQNNLAFITDAPKNLLMITDGTTNRRYANKVEDSYLK